MRVLIRDDCFYRNGNTVWTMGDTSRWTSVVNNAGQQNELAKNSRGICNVPDVLAKDAAGLVCKLSGIQLADSGDGCRTD
jgi:hypothetical protein